MQIWTFLSFASVASWHCHEPQVSQVQVTQSQLLKRQPEVARGIGVVRMLTRCHFSLVFEWNFSNGSRSPVTSILYNRSSEMWIFKCFLSLIHLLLHLKSVTANLFQRIGRCFSITSKTCNYEEIRKDSKDLSRLPRHISFVVLEPSISFTDLAQLIVWSMAMGIPYISVYDREGRLFVWLRLYDAIHGRPQTILLHPDQEA